MADIYNPALSNNIQGLTGAGYLNKLIPMLITGLFVIAALLTFFLFIIGGIQYLLSGGEKGAVENAKNRITHALIGLVLVFSTYAIITLLGTFFGLNLTTIDLDKLEFGQVQQPTGPAGEDGKKKPTTIIPRPTIKSGISPE